MSILIPLSRLTEEDKQRILQDYQEKMLIGDICSKYNISAKTIYRLLKERGISKRGYENSVKNFNKNKQKQYKVCKYCGSKINPIQAIYCCECGKVIVTDRDIVIRKLEKLTNYFIILEHKNRDKYIATINDIIKDVKNLNIVEDGE